MKRHKKINNCHNITEKPLDINTIVTVNKTKINDKTHYERGERAIKTHQSQLNLCGKRNRRVAVSLTKKKKKRFAIMMKKELVKWSYVENHEEKR